MKHRGQGIFVELILGLVAVMIIIAVAPSLQTNIVTSTSNVTLFPTSSPAYLIANIITFVWLATAIIILLAIVSRRSGGQ